MEDLKTYLWENSSISKNEVNLSEEKRRKISQRIYLAVKDIYNDEFINRSEINSDILRGYLTALEDVAHFIEDCKIEDPES